MYVGGKHTKWIILKKISTFHPKILTIDLLKRIRNKKKKKKKKG